jgi:putative transposase
VGRDNEAIAVARQCELLGLSRSSYYYSSTRDDEDDEYNLELMRLLDERYIGVRRLTAWLRARGYIVNPKRVRVLMRRMGLQAIYPHKRRSFSSPGHKRYPYLLEGVEIERPDQVWVADITYIRLAHGFVYLVAVMDWYSRYVLSWKLSNTLDSRFCIESLSKALWSSRPEIFNTDQGVQFTAQEFTEQLSGKGVKISMDGRGRVYDNILVERLWRTVKYEEVYLHEYQTVSEARQSLEAYFRFYNTERLHQGLGYRTPYEVYFGHTASKKFVELGNLNG